MDFGRDFYINNARNMKFEFEYKLPNSDWTVFKTKYPGIVGFGTSYGGMLDGPLGEKILYKKSWGLDMLDPGTIEKGWRVSTQIKTDDTQYSKINKLLQNYSKEEIQLRTVLTLKDIDGEVFTYTTPAINAISK